MFCGVFGHGDWSALIRAVPHQWVWRAVFVVFGLLLYRTSMNSLTSELRWIYSPARASHALLISYVAGGIIACAGASLDPRGAYAVYHDAALSSFGSSIGILAIARQLPKPAIDFIAAPMNRRVPWLIAALLASLFYILVLGPGIKATL
jgi:hypothetical protein